MNINFPEQSYFRVGFVDFLFIFVTANLYMAEMGKDLILLKI
jgi:hypothetical protein